MEIYEIVKKLNGEIRSVGETNKDDQKFENLKVVTKLVDMLLSDIDDVPYTNKDAHQFSIKRAGEFDKQFLDDTGIV